MSENSLEIRVAATTTAKDLAGSIVASYANGKEITISAIGPNPINTAIKAICIANRTLAPRGEVLCIIPGLINRKIKDHRQNDEERDWTIVMLRVRNVFDCVPDDTVKDILEGLIK